MAEKIWTPKSKDDLKKLINANISLSCIDTSLITDMSEVFKDSKRTDFSGLEKWNVSNVTTMKAMFLNAEHFNHNINSWDTSKVVDMSYMFCGAISFNQPLDKWNVANVENMAFMFGEAELFNQNINSWDTSSVRNMAGMFWAAIAFNQPLNNWLTIYVENMGDMFACAENFNQNINDWNVSNVINMGDYRHIEYIDGKLVELMECEYYVGNNSMGYELGLNSGGMFCYAKSFNQPLDKWNVASVKSMDSMFLGAKSFNQNLDSWNKEAYYEYTYDDNGRQKIGKMWIYYNDIFKGTQLEANQTLPKWFQKFLAEEAQKER